ncbi:MAG: substrate-binding domain-containing protein [Chloroflexota bacterium]
MDEFAKASNGEGKSDRARYRRIARDLREAIVGGVYQPGDHLPTEMELARTHAVSRVTASAALTELARAGLVTRTPRLGTIVRPGAQYARDAPRGLIAWILPNMGETYELGLLRGIERGAREAGFGLLIALSGSSHDEEARAIRDAVASGAAGIVLYLQDGESYNDEVLRLVLGGYPLVLVDRYLRGVKCAGVSSDNVGSSSAVVQELLGAGHRHICVLTYPPSDTSTIEDRMRGYVQALTAAGVPVDYSLHYVAADITLGRTDWKLPAELVDHFAGFLKTHAHVTAIYATNAQLGLLALRAIEHLGLKIPDEISLVCIDPVEAIPLCLRPLTTAVQQDEVIGTTAIQLLQEVLGGRPPRTVLLPMRVRRAGSVGPPRSATPP